MPTVSVDFPASPARVYAYLADPARRAEWQSSLRRVEDLRGDGGPGTTWTDVTAVGARPRMTTTVAEPGVAWAETGTWRGLAAELRLDLQSTAGGTRVVATFDLRGPAVASPLLAVLRRAAVLGIRGDLRRAAGRVGSTA